jgi:glycosyltransferase involved in cell wall biosynthesis
MRSLGHVVSLVMNSVEGDSRVIKTAKAAEAAGYRATIVGVANVEQPTRREIEGAQVVLVPNGALLLKPRGLWGAKEKRRIELLAESHLRSVVPAVEALQPTILHSHDMIGLRIGAAVSRKLAVGGSVVPWVHDLHEYVVGLTTIPEKFRLACMEYERRYLRQTDHLITVSERLAHEVKTYYRLRDLPTVVFNAPDRRTCDVSEPDLKSTLGLPPETKLVVYIGVAKKERGCETILRAVGCMPGVHICFVSQGPYVDGLRDLAAQLGMADRFHSTPYVESERVTSFIRTADVGTHGLTHYPNGEVAMPNKLFEYLHAGLPIAVSDVAEMKRFVELTKTGEVFKADNYVSCAYALGRTLTNVAKYKSNIAEALIEEYSWQSQAAKLKRIYDDLSNLSSGRANRRLIVGSCVSNEMSAAREAAMAAGDEVHTSVASEVEPNDTVDFYLDPSAKGDRAGVISRIAGKYATIEIVGTPNWPSHLDLMALKSAGLNVVGASVATAAHNLIGAIELEKASDDQAASKLIESELEREALAA